MNEKRDQISDPDWQQLRWEQEYQQWLESLDADEEYQQSVQQIGEDNDDNRS